MDARRVDASAALGLRDGVLGNRSFGCEAFDGPDPLISQAL
jgi:hypothetical protein